MTMDELESGQWTHARPLRSRLGRVENVRILDFNGRCPRRMGHFSIRLVSLHLDGKMVHLIVYEFFVPLDARRNSLTATVFTWNYQSASPWNRSWKSMLYLLPFETSNPLNVYSSDWVMGGENTPNTWIVNTTSVRVWRLIDGLSCFGHMQNICTPCLTSLP